MGRRGPPQAPTAEKTAKGETRPSRVNHKEPELPPVSTHRSPKGLDGAGKREWERLCPMLVAAAVLKDSDLMALEDYCRTISDLRKYENAAKRAGAERAIAKGTQGMVIKLRAQANQLRQQLGLTPSSRSNLRIQEPEMPLFDDDRFFGGPRGVVGGRESA